MSDAKNSAKNAIKEPGMDIAKSRWVADYSHPHSKTICHINADGNEVAVIYCADPNGDEGYRYRAEAAKLIAAAPELLEALMGMLDAFEWDQAQHTVLDRFAIKKAKAAIAKARGEA